MMNPAEPIRSDRLRLSPGFHAGVTEEMIHQVVHGFYARIRQDPALGPIFNRVIADDAWPAHLQKMCDFWSSVMLMSGRFHGAPMPAHLRIQGQNGDGFNARHFARWLHLFSETVAELCPPEAAALFEQKSQMIAQSLQLGIAASRGEIPSISQVALSKA
jgi:hemoglobin